MILTRRQEQTLVIQLPDGDMTLKVLLIDRGKVQLGVSGRKDIIVRRGELTAWTPKAASG